MRVLLIDVNCKHSSTGKIVYDLYSELNNMGHEAAICYGRGPLVEGKNIYKFGINIETYFHAFMTRLTGLTGIYSPISTKRLIKNIKKFQPDIVHIHELHAYFVNISSVINYLKKNKIKTVWTFHCEFMYTGKCGHAYECEKWKSVCRECPQVKEYPASLYLDFTRKMHIHKKKLFSGFDNLIIVTPSHWLKDRVKESFLKDKDIRVIHNGIDTKDIFYPRNFQHIKKKHNLTDEKIILSVAPNIMNDRKGGIWVLDIARQLRSDNVKFILIGIDNLNERFDHNIIALGRTANQKELAEYYSMADVTLITSQKETFSLVCAESLACGTPIVGFESGATSEIATEEYGRFVEYGNVELLHKILKKVIKSNLNIKLKEECKSFSKRNYSKILMAERYLSLYNEQR